MCFQSESLYRESSPSVCGRTIHVVNEFIEVYILWSGAPLWLNFTFFLSDHQELNNFDCVQVFCFVFETSFELQFWVGCYMLSIGECACYLEQSSLWIGFSFYLSVRPYMWKSLPNWKGPLYIYSLIVKYNHKLHLVSSTSIVHRFALNKIK